MNNLLLILSVFFVSINIAQADGINCSSPDSDLVYSYWYYMGGPMPYPGMVVSDTKLIFNGDILGQMIFKVGESRQQWDLDVEFDESTKVILESTGNESIGSVTYAQKIHIKKSNQGPLIPGTQIMAIDSFMICIEDWNRIRP